MKHKCTNKYLEARIIFFAEVPHRSIKNGSQKEPSPREKLFSLYDKEKIFLEKYPLEDDHGSPKLNNNALRFGLTMVIGNRYPVTDKRLGEVNKTLLGEYYHRNINLKGKDIAFHSEEEKEKDIRNPVNGSSIDRYMANSLKFWKQELGVDSFLDTINGKINDFKKLKIFKEGEQEFSNRELFSYLDIQRKICLQEKQEALGRGYSDEAEKLEKYIDLYTYWMKKIELDSLEGIRDRRAMLKQRIDEGLEEQNEIA